MAEAPPAPAFVSADFFVLRTPLLPFEELARWGEGLEGPRAPPDPAALEPALERDRATLRARLGALLQRTEVREALFVASPVLHESLGHWAREPDGDRGGKVERTLVRYLARMAGRATPFGLFAGSSLGAIGEQTRLLLGPRAGYQRHTRLDMDYTCALAETLARSPGLRPHLLHHPSTSLYLASGRLRYAEGRMIEKARSYHLVAVEPTDYLEATLARAAHGARPAELVRALVEADPEIDPAEAAAYVQELIDSQILVPELSPAVTGPEPLPALIAQLRDLPGGAPIADVLARTQAALDGLDRGGLGAADERYLEVSRALSELPAPVELPRLFQVDMVKPSPGAVLGREVVRELARGVELLHRLTPPLPEDDLRRFRAAFVQRYEGREVPLMEALDADAGVGFGPPSGEALPLLEGLGVGRSPGGAGPGAGFGPREAWLLHRIEQVQRTGSHVLALDGRDLERLETRDPLPLPDAFAAIATLAAGSGDAIDRGRFQLYLHAASGPSGANLLGRFCHVDPALHRKVEEHLRAEEAQRPGEAFAEIVHLPEGRVGNILARPVLREYEITYLGRSGALADRQLPAADLRVSVQGDRIVLRSARLGREIVPRMTNAHNFAQRSLALYRFLCMLQSQGRCPGMTWSWGLLANASFLPRVTHGRLVLSLARWRLWGEELEALGRLRGARRFAAVQALRAERRLPRFIALEEGDNVLPVDLDNVLSVETLVHLIQHQPTAALVEVFPEPEALCAEGPEGHFVHELIVPFVRLPAEAGRPPPDPIRPAAAPAPVEAERSFLPGSEWLYLKLYTGTETLDRLLTGAVAPLVKSVLDSGVADRWFFIRYSDPDWHLRLRFHGAPERLRELSGQLSTALESLRREGLLWKVQLDTYEREVERYGGPEAILLAEQLFQVDSEAVLELLGLLQGDAGAELRWRLMLCGMDLLLSDLGLDLDKRLQLLTVLRKEFGREHGVDGAVERRLGDKFRKERKNLETLLDHPEGADPALAPGVEVLRRRSTRLAPIAAGLNALAAAGRLTTPVVEIAGSFLHMHANRMARAEARAQELVLYDLLVRHYASRAARLRKARTADR